MKKKFIAVSVLICALALGSTTLTSCVDDNESASVTAIRDAKAQQLTSLANYQQAQASLSFTTSQSERVAQTHVHGVGDAIQPSHPLSSPSPPAPNPSQHLDGCHLHI